MRGAPFGWKNFARGLNTVDSPYTLQEGEARECLNVVSSPRGAIRKRYGSVTFGGAAVFPELAATDNFNRANESPLSNGGKWEAFLTEDNTGRLVTNEAVPKEGLNARLFLALWNAVKQKNPAVSVELSKAMEKETAPGIWACAAKGEALSNGYHLEVLRSTALPSTALKLYVYVAGSATAKLGEVPLPGFTTGSIGLTVRSGVVTAWVKYPGEPNWEKKIEATDATYSEGYGVIDCGNSLEVGFDNFTIGETAAPPSALEFLTLAPVRIGSTSYMIASAGKNLYSVNNEGVTSVIKEGLTENARWCVVQATSGSPNKKTAAGPVYLVNGKDKPLYWTGAAKGTEAKTWEGESGEYENSVKEKIKGYEDATSKEHVPNGKFMVYTANRIFMAGMSDDLSAVRTCDFSNLTEGGKQCDPTSWPALNVARFDTADSSPITGLGVVGPYVLVFKRYKVWAIFDPEELHNRRISDTTGCVAHRSIVETPQGTYFLTPDQGVYMTNGSTVHEVSRNVRPTFQKAAPTQLENAAGGYLNGHYYISFASAEATKLDKTLDYDTQIQSWWLHDLAANQWATWEPVVGTSVPALYIAKANGKNVLKAFVEGAYQDAGANYTGARGFSAYWISSHEPFFQYVLRHRIDAPNQKKRIRQWFIDGSGVIQPFHFFVFKTPIQEDKGVVNEADASEPKGEMTLTTVGGERETSACRIYSLGAHRVWSFGFGNKSNEGFEVDSMQFLVQFRRS